MKRHSLQGHLGVVFLMAVFYWGIAPPPAGSATAPVTPADFTTIRSTGEADINGWANWANSPPLRKFVDDLPGYCNDQAGALIGGGTGTSTLHQCIPIAVPNTTLYSGSDYYEIEVIQYREQLHSDLPVVVGAKDAPGATGGTLLRGYRQTWTGSALPGLPGVGHPIYTPHYLGPAIVAQKDRPVRIKFTNKLPAGLAGNLFLPTDTSVMGSGPGPNADRPWITANADRTAASPKDSEICRAAPSTCFTQNRADLHLHGGRTPWISDGTPHQWITPAGDSTAYDKGVSVAYVPDMWYLPNGGAMITNATHPGSNCAGNTFCSVAGATNNPGNGAQTYYYTNAQSARLMFYHDHAWGITRLNVYAGEAAPYIITDEADTVVANVPGTPTAANTIPLVIQDKTFVNANTNSLTDVLKTDPTWIWGSQPGTVSPSWTPGAGPVTGDLWWPHVYIPAQNPFQMDGINDYGRWHYGPYFFPPAIPTYGTKPNPYVALLNQPPEVPDIPNPSWGAEAFLDTPLINGTAYPKLAVAPQKYRFRILNAAHDRFFNLQFYVADTTGNTPLSAKPGYPIGNVQQGTEVKMIPAAPTPIPVPNNDGFDWPADGREGGVPDPATRGPAIVQIGTEGGYLPAPVVLLNRPVKWNTDPTLFNVGNVLDQSQGGGTLFLGPAERADIIVDFSNFAGKTLILYNDSPAPFPALDPHYDYYTNAPIRSDIGGAPAAYSGALISTPAGYGPNVRTLMKIVVGAGGLSSYAPVNDYDSQYVGDLTTAFTTPTTGIFAKYQEPIIVGQTAYNANYGKIFPTTWPNWGYSRISDTSLSYMTPDGSLVSKYPNEPKAIHDEMNSVFEEYGRISAKLGLEIGRTNAGTATFTMQNFVDPPTEIVAKDQVQIWKITHNGVDTHPVHFHLFEVQLVNRVAWDGFIRQPDANEIGWKDTVRISPLEDTIVALRPLTVPTPFNIPNSVRPLNPAYPLGARDAGFSNMDPVTGNATTTPTLNVPVNFGHEYVWHCHILSHEENDMMRAVVQNADSLLYTDNGANGFWEWNRGAWTQISATDPSSVVVSGTHAYATMANGLYEWNGYTWTRITPLVPTNMVASASGLYADFAGAAYGLYNWNGTVWTKITPVHPDSMVASGSSLFADFAGYGLYNWNGTVWTKITPVHPFNMVASGSNLYANFNGYGLYQWNGTVWTRMNTIIPAAMAPSGPDFYASFTGYGLYKWKGGGSWTKLSTKLPTSITASGSVLYANFTAGGSPSNLNKYELGSWSSLLNATPVTNMVAGF